jgi:hypothetical protein
MTAYLIALALAGLVALAVWEGCLERANGSIYSLAKVRLYTIRLHHISENGEAGRNNLNAEIPHRNPFAGARPHPNRAQCPRRHHALEGRHGPGTGVGGQRHPGPRLGQGPASDPQWG